MKFQQQGFFYKKFNISENNIINVKATKEVGVIYNVLKNKTLSTNLTMHGISPRKHFHDKGNQQKKWSIGHKQVLYKCNFDAWIEKCDKKLEPKNL
jgi:hypothetical protein